jgi:uncharacterized repeat protein (TIGR03803 family)
MATQRVHLSQSNSSRKIIAMKTVAVLDRASSARKARIQASTWISRNVLAVVAITLTLALSSWASSTEKVLYTFQGTGDGVEPIGGVVRDAKGNLYGTTRFNFQSSGPPTGFGLVYQLTPTKSGEFKEKVIYAFQGEVVDGQSPQSSVVFDAAGNLYGTADGGLFGCGIVYKLAPAQKGPWTETIIHQFNAFEGHNDGCAPVGSLIFDKAGNLYGTTSQGGGGTTDTFCTNGCGTVFKLVPNKDGSWTETILHALHKGGGGSPDGQNPFDSVVFDNTGNLYGTTLAGGPDDLGTVFKLTPATSGKWTETLLFKFHDLVNNPPDGASPMAGVVLDPSGNLYGTTLGGGGGAGGGGVVFKLTRGSDGKFKESVIHRFSLSKSGFQDGMMPAGGLIMDSAGNLFGTTFLGGGHNEPLCQIAGQQVFEGCGTIFKLTPTANGKWKERFLHAFQGDTDGGFPEPDHLTMDAAGNLYGTASAGGKLVQSQNGFNSFGVVFEILGAGGPVR